MGRVDYRWGLRLCVTPLAHDGGTMITEGTTRVLWVRSGGRCAVCYRDLLVSGITWKQVPLGERAHIVGRSTGSKSPRGDDPLPVEDRDAADNLMLLCGVCHDDLDDTANLDVLTVERLRVLKHAHESRIEQILAVPPDNSTVVLRMPGIIGTAGVHIDRSAAAAAVLAASRIAQFPFGPDRTGLEIDLRRVTAPNSGNEQYYTECRRQIDQFFDRQFLPAVADGSVHHLSVFALARWPLLVHLGARLGDKIVTDVYQKHRGTDQWAWPISGEDNRFAVETIIGDDADEAVLVMSMSAAVYVREVPTELAGRTTYRVVVDGGVTPHYDVIGTPDSLRSAERAWRDVFADIELNRKHVRRVHVIGAAPVSACVALGRAMTRGVHPTLVLYDRRDDGTYHPALEVN